MGGRFFVGTHLEEVDLDPSSGCLPGGFTAGEATADYAQSVAQADASRAGVLFEASIRSISSGGHSIAYPHSF